MSKSTWTPDQIALVFGRWLLVRRHREITHASRAWHATDFNGDEDDVDYRGKTAEELARKLDQEMNPTLSP